MAKKNGKTVKILGALGLAGVLGAGAWIALADGGPRLPPALGGSRSVEGFEPGDAVMRRLTAEQYQNVIADIFGPAIRLGGRFEPDLRQEGLFAVGASYVSVTGSGMEQYDAMARTIAEQVVDEQHRGLTIPCEPADAEKRDDACAESFLAETGKLLFRRPLTPEQLDGYVEAAGEATEILGDFHEGLSLSLAAMLSSPQFLFINQVTEPDPRNRGDNRLDAYSKASQLSFFLWNSTPDARLLAAAESGALHDRKGLEEQVNRMIESPRLEQGVRAFFIDNFHFDEFETLAKDAELFPKFNAEVAAAAREQTLKTVVNLLVNERDDFRKIFTVKKTFLTPQLGAIYQVPIIHDGPNGAPETWQPYEFPADDPRGGILTHLSFTGLHSPPGRGSPTIRGDAVRDVMLCQKVPAPPADVSFDLVNDMSNPALKTARDRLNAHNEVPSCAGCHKLMDPLGLALENFDGSGAFRTRENGVLIDTSGELDGVEFADAAGLGEAIQNSPAATSCIVNRLSSYARGRAPERSEKPWVRALEEHFAEAGYRFPALMKRIAMSEEFYRVAPPEIAVASAETEKDVSVAMAEGGN